MLHPWWQRSSASPTAALPAPPLASQSGVPKKRRAKDTGADPGRGILPLSCRSVFGPGNVLDTERGESPVHPKPQLKVWGGQVNPKSGGGRPQLCLQFGCKIEKTAKNLLSPLRPESISAFLNAGLQQHCLPPAVKPPSRSPALPPGRRTPPARGACGRDLGWQSILPRKMGSLCSNQGDGLSVGDLDAPPVPVS